MKIISPNMAAVVTGGASGLGRGVAEGLAAQGVKVSIFDVNPEGESVAKAIGGRFYDVDVKNPSAIQSALKDARKNHGQERICVNCAGIAPAQKTVSRGTPHDADTFADVIAINVMGSFYVASQSAAGMAELDPINNDGERGVIINTASVAAYDGQIGQVAYATSKGGIASMTLPMARDLADKGIRVMGIAPGIFATPMLKAFPQDVQDALAEQIPFPKRLGQAEEFARLVHHIIENPMLNGEVIRLDGGIRMPPK